MPRDAEEVSRLTAGTTPPSYGTREGAFTPRSLFLLRVGSFIATVGFFALLTWTIEVHGHPFKSSLLTPWMNTTLVDFYLNLLPILLWIGWRHRTQPLIATAVCLYLCCLGSGATWSYIWVLAMRLRAGDAISKLFTGKDV